MPGIERLEDERKERAEARQAEEEAARAAGQHIPGRRNANFAETLRTLTRLSSSYRRCHWKSAAEVIFPLLYQHLTYASHRSWKLYVKKAIFFGVEAWRRHYGDSILNRVVDRGDEAEPVILCRPGLDDLELKGWKKVQRSDPATGVIDELFIGPSGQACPDITTAFDAYLAESQARRSPQQRLTLVQELLKLHAVTEEVATDDARANVTTNLQSLQASGEDVAVKTSSTTEARYLAVTTSSMEDYLFRGDHPLVAGMSWATYGTWVYRIELPPGPKTSVRSALPRHVDVCFHPAYKLATTHVQRISTEPRVPMFEGFTMPPLTHDPERNAMYKQIQCRPFAVQTDGACEQTMAELVVNAFATLSQPQKSPPARDLSVQAATAFTQCYTEWAEEMETEAQMARFRFGQRFEFPSLWETQEMVDLLTEKLAILSDDGVPAIPRDFDAKKPRCTVAMYSSMLAQQRVANLEGLARARQSKPKRRRDLDAQLYEEYVKVTTAGEGDNDVLDADNEEELDTLLQDTLKPTEVFQPIRLKTSIEEQRKLLKFELQGRRNEYTKEFLQETWLKVDPFAFGETCRETEKDSQEQLYSALLSLNQAGYHNLVHMVLFFRLFSCGPL